MGTSVMLLGIADLNKVYHTIPSNQILKRDKIENTSIYFCDEKTI